MTRPTRLVRLTLIAAVLPVTTSVAACGTAQSGAVETLPPLRTTTSTTTTTTTPFTGRIFYEVQPNDNLSEIARQYRVPREEIVRLNSLPNGGETIQPGQILEIPNDMRLDTSLPTVPPTSEDADEP